MSREASSRIWPRVSAARYANAAHADCRPDCACERWIEPPLTRWTWLDAEAYFPGCSAAWDRDGGPDRDGGRPGLAIVLNKSGLAVGWGDVAPFGWALWDEDHEHWIFVGTDVSPRDVPQLLLESP